MDKETVWLSLDQMAGLFGRDKSTISRHIKNVFDEQELEPISVVANFATTAADGNKRIAAALFVYFLGKQKLLYKKDGSPVIDNSTLAAMTLMIALSRPDEKETMVKLVMNFMA
jgi:prophage maintenance system killer protein